LLTPQFAVKLSLRRGGIWPIAWNLNGFPGVFGIVISKGDAHFQMLFVPHFIGKRLTAIKN
jgi:hypothetical protein